MRFYTSDFSCLSLLDYEDNYMLYRKSDILFCLWINLSFYLWILTVSIFLFDMLNQIGAMSLCYHAYFPFYKTTNRLTL